MRVFSQSHCGNFRVPCIISVTTTSECEVPAQNRHCHRNKAKYQIRLNQHADRVHRLTRRRPVRYLHGSPHPAVKTKHERKQKRILQC